MATASDQLNCILLQIMEMEADMVHIRRQTQYRLNPLKQLKHQAQHRRVRILLLTVVHYSMGTNLVIIQIDI